MSIKYSKGIMWLDDCRIPFVNNTDFDKSIGGMGSIWGNNEIGKGEKIIPNQQGRFSPNLLVCDDMLNDGVVRKGFNGGGGPTRFAGAIGGKKLDEYNYYGDSGSSSRYYDLDKWFDKLINELK